MSIPWVAALYSRLGEAEKSFDYLLRFHNAKVISNNLMSNQGAALEQCFGHTAAMAEMLLQSHNDKVRLLPALPKAWSEGEVKGLVARGGFEVLMKWQKGQLTEAMIEAKHAGSIVVSYQGREISLNLQKGETKTLSLNAKSELQSVSK